MKFGIIIPAHNEALYLHNTLDSLLRQSFTPWRIVVVNDQSTDQTWDIAQSYAQKHNFIFCVNVEGNEPHTPGGKVVRTFNKGLPLIKDSDVICKFDADLIFPSNYLLELKTHFENNPKTGMCGGFCYIQKSNVWTLENLTLSDHLRGPIKAYRQLCFQQIGGLKPAMGWDTADELLARFYNWDVVTLAHLHVKHLRPTGAVYKKSSHLLQGKMFYTLRYGFLLSMLACAKLAFKKRSFRLFLLYIQGYCLAVKERTSFLVTKQQGQWIRNYRYRSIFKRFFSCFSRF